MANPNYIKKSPKNPNSLNHDQVVVTGEWLQATTAVDWTEQTQPGWAPGHARSSLRSALCEPAGTPPPAGWLLRAYGGQPATTQRYTNHICIPFAHR